MQPVQPVPRATRRLVCIQFLLGIGATLAIALPFLRRTHGLNRLAPPRRYLFVSNHVSLLDTILLGGLCWRSGCYPMLTLGDKSVWHASWVKKILSSKIGFLLERGKLHTNRIEELATFGRLSRDFHLLVFPEGTRGDGVTVAACQAGIYFIAHMQHVSTKRGGFHPLRGFRKVEVYYGAPIAPETYLPLGREEFCDFVRQNIQAAGTKRD